MSRIPRERRAPEGTRRKSILLADEERGIRDLFRFTFEPLGYDVVAVNDARDVTEQLEDRPFDLVVLNADVSRRKCRETVRRIRGIRSAQKVMLVGSGSVSEDIFGAQSAENEVALSLIKPFELDELVCAVETFIAGDPR